MTSSIIVTAAVTPDEPAATPSRASTAAPEHDDNGGESFNRLLTEQTARALGATHREESDATKPNRRSKTKGDTGSMAEASTEGPLAGSSDEAGVHAQDQVGVASSAPTQIPALIAVAGTSLGSSNEPGESENSTPSTAAGATATAPVSALPRLLQITGNGVEEATAVPPRESTHNVETTEGATVSAGVDVSTEEESPALATVGTPMNASVPLTSEHGLVGDKTAVVQAAASETGVSSSASPTSLPSSSVSLSDAELVLLRSPLAPTNDAPSSAPSSRVASASSASPEGSSTGSATHRSDPTRITETTVQDVSPTTFATSARAVANSSSNAASEEASPSPLDVADLATSISQATLGADGTYTLNVAMHPNELGHIQALVSLNGVDLHVALTPQSPAAHAALSNAVDGLKSELSRGGLTVNVSLRDPESRSGANREELPAGASSDETLTEEAEGVVIDESLAVSQIHLIL